MMKINKIKNKKAGFILVMSILIMSIFLTIAITATSLALKEISISSVGTESDFAFYMADSALECALYNDLHNPNRVFLPNSGVSNIQCGLETVAFTNQGYDGSYFNTEFVVNYMREDQNIKDCASVYVYKYFTADFVTGEPVLDHTYIYSQGRTHCDNPGFYNTERALWTSYSHVN